jgi:hypothetical protein
MQEEPEEETHVVRRVTLLAPKHVRIVPFRAGQVCSFVHLAPPHTELHIESSEQR